VCTGTPEHYEQTVREGAPEAPPFDKCHGLHHHGAVRRRVHARRPESSLHPSLFAHSVPVCPSTPASSSSLACPLVPCSSYVSIFKVLSWDNVSGFRDKTNSSDGLQLSRNGAPCRARSCNGWRLSGEGASGQDREEYAVSVTGCTGTL